MFHVIYTIQSELLDKLYGLAVKRSGGVTPEADPRECTLHLPLQKMNKAEPTLTLKPRGDVTRNPKQGYRWPQKGHVSAKNFKKNYTGSGIPIGSHVTCSVSSIFILCTRLSYFPVAGATSTKLGMIKRTKTRHNSIFFVACLSTKL